MSQTVASPRHLARPARGRTKAPLTVVSGRHDALGSGAFVLLCLAVLVTGFVAVLIVNVNLAKGSFELRDLQVRSGTLADTAENLQHDIDDKSAPAVLAQRALALGMVPSEKAAFLRLSDGKVLGVAHPATERNDFKVVTSSQATPPKPATSGTAKAKAPSTTKTVTKKGSVTTTKVVTKKADGTVETMMTTVDSAKGTSVTKTTVTGRKAPAKTTAAPSGR